MEGVNSVWNEEGSLKKKIGPKGRGFDCKGRGRNRGKGGGRGDE